MDPGVGTDLSFSAKAKLISANLQTDPRPHSLHSDIVHEGRAPLAVGRTAAAVCTAARWLPVQGGAVVLGAGRVQLQRPRGARLHPPQARLLHHSEPSAPQIRARFVPMFWQLGSGDMRWEITRHGGHAVTDPLAP